MDRCAWTRQQLRIDSDLVSANHYRDLKDASGHACRPPLDPTHKKENECDHENCSENAADIHGNLR
jgi:hypothetical protein